MRIPELSYPHETDALIARSATVSLGGLTLAVEAVTMAGTPNKANQDAFGFNLSSEFGEALYAGVFDGARSRDASHYAQRFLEEEEGIRSAYSLLSSVNERLKSVKLRGGASTATIVGVLASGDLELAHVTDSWAMVLKNNNQTELLTVDQHERFDRVALKVLTDVAIEMAGHDALPDLMAARRDPRVTAALEHMFATVRNTIGGEGILNGGPLERHIQSLEEPLAFGDGDENVAMVLLGSDGARFPYHSETDPAYRRGFFYKVQKYGVEMVVHDIQKAEMHSPPTVRRPRWHTHDDKTLVSLERR